MTTDNDDLVDVIAGVAAADPEIAGAVREIALIAIRKLRYYLENGSPPMQMQILRSFIPALIREMNKTSDEDGMGEMKEEFEKLRKEMMQGVAGAED